MERKAANCKHVQSSFLSKCKHFPSTSLSQTKAKFKHVQSTFLSKYKHVPLTFLPKKRAKYKHVQPTFLSARSKVCKQSLLCKAGFTKGRLSERKSEMKRKVRNVNMSNQNQKVQNINMSIGHCPINFSLSQVQALQTEPFMRGWMHKEEVQ